MFIIDAIKHRVHRDIVADPLLHGLVLNWYLNGEQYPHRVDDYFPPDAAAEFGLTERFAAHMRDEDKHVRLYIKAVEKLQQPVLELPVDSIFNHTVRRHTPTSFTLQPGDGADTRRLKLAHFLAHVHWIEVRIANSLRYHVDACSHSATPFVAKAVATVLHDEIGHVVYTREAVHDLLPRRAALQVLAEHQRAERRANFDFSAGQLRGLVRDHAGRFPAASRPLYRACAWVMRGLLPSR